MSLLFSGSPYKMMGPLSLPLKKARAVGRSRPAISSLLPWQAKHLLARRGRTLFSKNSSASAEALGSLAWGWPQDEQARIMFRKSSNPNALGRMPSSIAIDVFSSNEKPRGMVLHCSCGLETHLRTSQCARERPLHRGIEFV